MAAVVALSGLLTVVVIARVFHLDQGLAAGGLTQSAIIGTAGSAIEKLDLAADEVQRMQANVAIGYAVTYIFSSFGAIIMCVNVLQWLTGRKIREDAIQAEQELFQGVRVYGIGESPAAPRSGGSHLPDQPGRPSRGRTGGRRHPGNRHRGTHTAQECIGGRGRQPRTGGRRRAAGGSPRRRRVPGWRMSCTRNTARAANSKAAARRWPSLRRGGCGPDQARKPRPKETACPLSGVSLRKTWPPAAIRSHMRGRHCPAGPQPRCRQPHRRRPADANSPARPVLLKATHTGARIRTPPHPPSAPCPPPAPPSVFSTAVSAA